MSRPRFLVASVHGYNMTGDGKGQEVTDYLVMDTAVNHRVVGAFPAPPKGNPGKLIRKGQAERLAEVLNRGDAAWREALARELDGAA